MSVSVQDRPFRRPSMWSSTLKHLNFYRLHLLFFILAPLTGSVILWAANGKFPIEFIDALFICISGATGTGLQTIDLSSLTPFQRSILVLLEFFGNQAFVAWVCVLIRRSYFRHHLEHIVDAEIERTTARHDTILSHEIAPAVRTVTQKILGIMKGKGRASTTNGGTTHLGTTSRDSSAKVRPDMIRRVDLAPRPIDPMGRYDNTSQDSQPHRVDTSFASGVSTQARSRRPSTTRPHPEPHQEADFGGFPYPQALISRGLRKTFPSLYNSLRWTMTMPRTETLVPSTSQMEVKGASKPVQYISFKAIVGRNSVFKDLTAENIEELGGVEYRALSALLWIVPVYYLGILAISFVVIAPYMSIPRWRDIFQPPQQHRVISPVWFSAFQVIGAWANTGMSLVDQNMVPFQSAYPMIIFLVFCVLAGNTCLPIFLRFLIWIFTKILPNRSRTKESLHFLLDHPRRCFIYLFPSYQTWLLLGIVALLNGIDFIAYIVLDLGNPAFESIPTGRWFILALLSAASVRSSGLSAISASSLMPAVQVLYIVMMYIAIFPIAMSVRSTNVYEERSLGVYDNEEAEDSAPSNPQGDEVAIWGKHLKRHVRKQLSFDMWWLALSLFLLCIIERDNLTNPQNTSWFNIFALLFELISAYGTVGLSLGVPFANYSFSGALHTLSKLILIAVMLRGRHRGLPIALDRSIMLPHEFRLHSKQSTPQDRHRDADPEKQDERDHKSSSEMEEHGGDRLRSMTSSLPMIHEEIQTPKSGGSGSHVIWPTDEAIQGTHV